MTGMDAVASALAFDWRAPGWHNDAACTSLTPAEADRLLFFDAGNITNEARQMCGHCPVQAQCAEAGLADPFSAGVWGGLTEADRARARRGLVA